MIGLLLVVEAAAPERVEGFMVSEQSGLRRAVNWAEIGGWCTVWEGVKANITSNTRLRRRIFVSTAFDQISALGVGED